MEMVLFLFFATIILGLVFAVEFCFRFVWEFTLMVFKRKKFNPTEANDFEEELITKIQRYWGRMKKG